MAWEDAVDCAEAGVRVVAVSNHGGRVLDSTPGVAEVLPAIVERLKGRVLVTADGGVRTGYDVLKMLALGANAVLVGRDVIRAAVGGGAAGVQMQMDRLGSVLSKAMVMTHKTLLGTHDWYEDLSASLIARQTADGGWPGGGWLSGQQDRELTTCYSILSMQTRSIPPDADLSMSIILASTADLHVYDPFGRHVGINYDTNEIEIGIPGATFQLLDADDNEVPYTGDPIPDGIRQYVTLPVTALSGTVTLMLVPSREAHMGVTLRVPATPVLLRVGNTTSVSRSKSPGSPLIVMACPTLAEGTRSSAGVPEAATLSMALRSSR